MLFKWNELGSFTKLPGQLPRNRHASLACFEEPFLLCRCWANNTTHLKQRNGAKCAHNCVVRWKIRKCSTVKSLESLPKYVLGNFLINFQKNFFSLLAQCTFKRKHESGNWPRKSSWFIVRCQSHYGERRWFIQCPCFIAVATNDLSYVLPKERI